MIASVDNAAKLERIFESAKFFMQKFLSDASKMEKWYLFAEMFATYCAYCIAQKPRRGDVFTTAVR